MWKGVTIKTIKNLKLLANGRSDSLQRLDLQYIVGRVQPIRPCTFVECAWKSCTNGFNIVVLRFGDHGTKEMFGVVGSKSWPVWNFAQNDNKMRRGVQTDVTCSIHQCWESLANNVVSVCKALNDQQTGRSWSKLLFVCFYIQRRSSVMYFLKTNKQVQVPRRN